MVAAIRRAVQEAGADVRLSGLVAATTLEAPILARFRFTALLLTAVAGAALVLAIAGLYGAITTMVERRRHEIGIRIALGALPGAIASLIARQGLLLTAAGTALGSAVALAGTRLLSALLYGVGPTDPATMVGVIVLLLLVAIAACAIPVRRAVRVDPLTAISKE
jgi:putative ABC transport system permease protein